jgi:hypothetical protein
MTSASSGKNGRVAKKFDVIPTRKDVHFLAANSVCCGEM